MIPEIYRKYDRKIHPKIENTKPAKIFRWVFKRAAFFSLERFDRTPRKEMNLKEEEWDNLAILDGCRHDIFEEVKGETDFRYSPGSNSSEFIIENFSEGDWSDTVYVTGNPHFHESKFKELTGKKAEDVFHTVFHTYETGWNKEKGTVMPQDLIEDAKTGEKLFPDKKLIIHFMQPHYPFVNSEIQDKGIRQDLDHDKEGLSAWEQAERGKYTRKELWPAYKKNLEFVLEQTEEFLEKLDGETVIASDHGNLVGDKGFYGHPYGIKAEELLKVPWYEL